MDVSQFWGGFTCGLAFMAFINGMACWTLVWIRWDHNRKIRKMTRDHMDDCPGPE